MDVSPPSKSNIAGGALAEHKDAFNNANIASNRSSIFNPKISGCPVQGDLTINITHFSDQDKQKQVDVNPESEINDQQMLQSNQCQNKEKEILLIRDVINRIKMQQKIKSASVLEGIGGQGKSVLDKVYTELYIVTCDSTSINKEHEVWHAETAHLKDASEASVVKCQDIFKQDEDKIRCVMTKGIAGIGKTVAAQKLNLDWAVGKVNQNFDFIFFLSFRKLNLIKDQQSLHEILQVFYPELKDINVKMFDKHQILFILDGLDESQMKLEFDEITPFSDVTKSAPLNVLLTNLIAGVLLPDAYIWITSRPVAANQIPLEHISRVTEIRGFNDTQKDEYFKRKISDPEMASRIISCIKKSRSLYIMCHIPVFSWMAVTVLQDILIKADKSVPKPQAPLPTTITEMYIHYFRIQTYKSFVKLSQNDRDNTSILMLNKDIILKLGKLAYENLERQNMLFTEQDLNTCGINVSEAAMCPGLCTELEELEYGLYPKKLYCFIHLSVQEFFAALYARYEFENLRFDLVKAILKRRKGNSNIDFLKGAIDSALDSKNGHLDLFTRFLVGISHVSGRDLLQGILGKENSTSEWHKKLVNYIKTLKRKNLSPERCINLIHCLLQLKDHSLLQRDNNQSSDAPLTPFQCSLLAYTFIISEKPEQFDFRNKKTSEEGFSRLSPALLSCTKALLNFCQITPPLCATVANVLRSQNSRVTVLDLSHNYLGDAGVRRLCDGLLHSDCNVEHLNLSHNNVGVQGVKNLCEVLICPTSKLRILDLSCNDFGDSGLELLASALYVRCKLQVLRLSGCLITLPEDVKLVLSIALRSDPYQMKELDLSYNSLRNIYVDFPLELIYNMDHREESRSKEGLHKYGCELTLDPSTVNGFLLLSEGNRKVSCQKKMQTYPDTIERFDKCNQVLCKESLCERHYLEVDCLQDVHIGLVYKCLERKWASDCVRLGHNANSWALYISDSKSHVKHKSFSHNLHLPEFKSSVSYRVGVFLDWPAGILSFYMVNNGTLTPLYGFYTTFTEPLYVCIGLNTPTATVSLLTSSLK
ncbi:hypothetical protein UPYG_G00108880 [Umbra pygmaea]|uniref:Uncharacterized protein n=1 Tax=Umbra pygmaea TaxID=75934 RepID=A0ABD0X2G8_UMBPY